MHKTHVLILGGGAAGLFCALHAAKRGREVIILEQAEKVGKKILISGGGRCNFTNLSARAENYLSQNPHFCKSALARYTPQDFLALVEQHGITWHEKKLGQLFCDTSSRDIVQMLEQECDHAGVRICTNAHITSVEKKESTFAVQTNIGVYTADSLVVATGGPSIPKMGATDFGYKLARQFGLSIIEPRPALVPLTFDAEEFAPYTSLSGVSLDALVSCNNASFRENILFTHRGLSGPAILQISSYWRKGDSIAIDLSPGVDLTAELLARHSSKMEMKNVLAQFLPKRFCDVWCDAHAQYIPPNKSLVQFKHKEIEDIAQQLQHWELHPIGSEGFAKAEVTAGGVDTNELSSKTMEARRVPGLYFIGEVVDVTGWLGGYNFQWAWSSGFAAGQVV